MKSATIRNLFMPYLQPSADIGINQRIRNYPQPDLGVSATNFALSTIGVSATIRYRLWRYPLPEKVSQPDLEDSETKL